MQHGAVPAPTGNVGRRDQNGGSYFDGSQTHPHARGAPTIVCCAPRNYLEREQAANVVKFLKTQARERERQGEREAAEDAPLLRASFMGNICSSQLTFIQFIAFKCGRSVIVYLASSRTERTCSGFGDKPSISVKFTSNQPEYFCRIPD